MAEISLNVGPTNKTSSNVSTIQDSQTVKAEPAQALEKKNDKFVSQVLLNNLKTNKLNSGTYSHEITFDVKAGEKNITFKRLAPSLNHALDSGNDKLEILFSKYGTCTNSNAIGLHLSRERKDGRDYYTIKVKNDYELELNGQKIEEEKPLQAKETGEIVVTQNPGSAQTNETKETTDIKEEPEEQFQFMKTISKDNLRKCGFEGLTFCNFPLQDYKGEFYEYEEPDGSKSLIYSGDKERSAIVLRKGADKWADLTDMQKESLNCTQRERAEAALREKLGLKRAPGEDAYVQDGYEKKFYIQVEPKYELTQDFVGTLEDVINEKLSVFFEGGKDPDGDELSPQTYHHGKWDKTRSIALSTLAERLMGTAEKIAGALEGSINTVISTVPKELEKAVEGGLKELNSAIEVATNAIERERKEAAAQAIIKHYGREVFGMALDTGVKAKNIAIGLFKESKAKILESANNQLDSDIESNFSDPILIKKDKGLLPTILLPFAIKIPGGKFTELTNGQHDYVNGFNLNSNGEYDATDPRCNGEYGIKIRGKEYTFNVEPELTKEIRIKPGEEGKLPIPPDIKFQVKPSNATVFSNPDSKPFGSGFIVKPDGSYDFAKGLSENPIYTVGTYTVKTNGGQEMKVVIENDAPKTIRVKPGDSILIPEGVIIPQVKFAKETNKVVLIGKGIEARPDGKIVTRKNSSGLVSLETAGGQKITIALEKDIPAKFIRVNPGEQIQLKGYHLHLKGPNDSDYRSLDKRTKLDGGFVAPNGLFKTTKVGKYEFKTEGGQECTVIVEPDFKLPETIISGEGKLNIAKHLNFSIRMPGATKDVHIEKSFTGAGGIVINPDGSYNAPENLIGYSIKFKTEGRQEQNVTIMPKVAPKNTEITEIGFGEARKELERLKAIIQRNVKDDEIDNQTKKRLYEFLRNYSQSIHKSLLDSMTSDFAMFDIWGKHYKEEAIKFDSLAHEIND